MDQIANEALPEVAFYYPNPFWTSGSWIKNLILFFDGVGLLVPVYMQDRIDKSDPAIVAGLREHSLLHVFEPEKLVDKPATERLADTLVDISFPALSILLSGNTPNSLSCRCPDLDTTEIQDSPKCYMKS